MYLIVIIIINIIILIITIINAMLCSSQVLFQDQELWLMKLFTKQQRLALANPFA